MEIDRSVRLELVSLPTDTHPLDGVWYRPEPGPARGAALLMHGNQGNFYTGPSRFLPPALARIRLASLAFNRRGHDILTTHGSRAPVGGALQTAAEQVADNRAAAAFLRERGFERPVLIGHSNGGLLAARQAADDPAPAALVLLSAPGGGPQATRVESSAGLLLKDRYEELVAEARRLVAEGRGQQLMLLPGWWWLISAESLCDRLDALPDLIALAPSIRCPVLCLKGRDEPEAVYPARAFAAAAGGRAEVLELDGLDHWYTGREHQVADVVGDWLDRTLKE